MTTKKAPIFQAPWDRSYDFRGYEISPRAQQAARLRAMASWIGNLADSVESDDEYLARQIQDTLRGNGGGAVEWASDQWTDYLRDQDLGERGTD